MFLNNFILKGKGFVKGYQNNLISSEDQNMNTNWTTTGGATVAFADNVNSISFKNDSINISAKIKQDILNTYNYNISDANLATIISNWQNWSGGFQMAISTESYGGNTYLDFWLVDQYTINGNNLILVDKNRWSRAIILNTSNGNLLTTDANRWGLTLPNCSPLGYGFYKDWAPYSGNINKTFAVEDECGYLIKIDFCTTSGYVTAQSSNDITVTSGNNTVNGNFISTASSTMESYQFFITADGTSLNIKINLDKMTKSGGENILLKIGNLSMYKID